MRRQMAERHLTFRALSLRTRELDPRTRGLTHAYLSQIAKHEDMRVSLESIELICQALGLDPNDVAEYRLAVARRMLDEREVELDEALANLRIFESGQQARLPEDGLSLDERLEAAGRAAQEIRESHQGRSREPGSDIGDDSAAGSSR